MAAVTDEVKERMREVIAQWNQGWRAYYKKNRLTTLYDFSTEAIDFLSQFEVTGSYPIYGMMLYGKVGDRKCVLKNDHYDYGWMLSYNGTKDFKPVDELLNLTDEQMEKFTNFFDTYDFTGIINAMKIAERKHVVDDRRERFVGKKIVDIIKKGSSFVVVLDDGSQFPCGDFLGFRGNIGSAFRKK